jgi:protein-tyrosine phosphatase
MGSMRHVDPYRVCFVCSGNICRSPIAEAVLRRLVDDAGLTGRVEVDSAGTGDWHVGERADRRARTALLEAGYPDDGHRARQFELHWFAERDLVIALDRGHLRTLRSWAPTNLDRAKVRLLRSFDPSAGSRPDTTSSGADVADPYYDGPDAFREVLVQIETACQGLLTHVGAELAHATVPDSSGS